MSKSKLVINLSGNGSVKEVYPDPYNQTYDSHLITHDQPKTVQRVALCGLHEFVKQNPSYSDIDFSVLQDFLNAYVSAGTKGRCDRVRWNSKSYPD